MRDLGKSEILYRKLFPLFDRVLFILADQEKRNLESERLVPLGESIEATQCRDIQIAPLIHNS